MPEIRPFRALRFEPEVVGDLSRVVAPPYDVIPPERARTLLERHPKNAVRLDLPMAEPNEDPDERYRRAARTFAAWRSDATLRKEPRPAVYVYEQTYRVPGTDEERTQRGFFARLRLEPLAPGSGVLAHERTMTGPKEDRYRLLRATGANTSPVVLLYEDPAREAAALLANVAGTPPAICVEADDEGVSHRLWIVPDERPVEQAADASEGVARALARIAGAAPVVIADGHHRYETALRYRDERRMTRSCEEDPAFDYTLALLLATSEPLTVLPTHRLVRGLADGGSGLPAALGRLFDLTSVPPGEVVATFRRAADLPGGRGRFGLLTRDGAWLLEARRPAFGSLVQGGGPAARGLDATLLGAALESAAGVSAADVAAGAIGYTKSADEAADAVRERADGVDAAVLMEPTPVASILEVARAGDVMPQKSTYFFPKALTGLVINPHEW